MKKLYGVVDVMQYIVIITIFNMFNAKRLHCSLQDSTRVYPLAAQRWQTKGNITDRT